MRLVSYRGPAGRVRLGAVVGDVIVDLAGLAGGRPGGRPPRWARSMLALIQAGPDALRAARQAVEHGEALLRTEGMTALAARGLALARERAPLEAPLPRPPRNIICLGRNYREHAAERGADAPAHPVFFTKAPDCVLAPGGTIVRHACTHELDYEVELAVVIGRAGRDIPAGRALEHVFGYTIVNDVTARDLQKRHGQWFKGKTLDTFCPMGPVLVTADEIPDPQGLALHLRVNGELRQASHTSKMIFPVAECLAILSEGFTLRPGDVIATGTPEGVGAARGVFLQPGDLVEAEIERIGVLANRVAAP